MAHIGVHHLQTEVDNHAAQFLNAFFIGGNHGAQVGHVLLDVACRVLGRLQQGDRFGLAQTPFLDQQEVVYEHPLLLDVLAVGRHGTRGDAADVGMVAARTDIKQDVPAGVIEHRRDDGNVGQVGAAVVGRVEHVDVAGFHLAGVLANHRTYRFAHRSKVHRHVRRIGDEFARLVEHRAGKIQALLDIHRVGGVGQTQAHLLGDGHVEVVENLQHHRIDLGAHGVALRPRLNALEYDVIARREFGLPAGLHHGGGIGLGNDGRPLELVTRLQRIASEHRRRVMPAAGEHLHRLGRLRRADARTGRRHRLGRRIRGAYGLDRHRLGDQPAIGHQEGIAHAIGRLELGDHPGNSGEFYDQGRIGTVITQVHALDDTHAFGRQALPE